MIELKTNVALDELNTFHMKVKAKQFIEINTIDEAKEVFKLVRNQNLKFLILGGGSNVLFRDDFDGLVVCNHLKGIEVSEENGDHVLVKVGAGENWHEFVTYCIDKNWAGLENLSLIPGNVGASPMQNIGAYGVEVKDRIVSVEALNLESGKMETFQNKDCQFGYRSSIFKTSLKNKMLITSVVFKLDKTPTFNTSYGAILEELDRMKVKDLSIAAVSEAVCNIRRSKLPDPKEIGNAGSFFKNPVVSRAKAEEVRKNYPDASIYPVNESESKLAAGWLIEKCGWKGFRCDDYGVHQKQALVLVNYGNASGKEIYDLSEKILSSVREKFGVELEREVNII